MEGFANTPFAFQPEPSLRGKKRTASARVNSPARTDKDAWIFCLKCKQQGHLMRDCEKVREELQQALAEQLEQQLNGASPQEDAVMSTEAEASENPSEKDDENIVEPVKRIKFQGAAIKQTPDGDVPGNPVDTTDSSGSSNSFGFQTDVQRAREPMIALNQEDTMQCILAQGHEPMEAVSMSLNLLNL